MGKTRCHDSTTRTKNESLQPFQSRFDESVPCTNDDLSSSYGCATYVRVEEELQERKARTSAYCR